MKEAELSWLDARIIRKSAIVPVAIDQMPGDEKESDEFTDHMGENQQNVAESMEEGEGEKVTDEAVKTEGQTEREQTDGEKAEETDEPMDETLAKEATEEAEGQSTTVSARKSAVRVPDQLFLELLPSSAIPPHQSVFVNDPKVQFGGGGGGGNTPTNKPIPSFS